MDLIGIEPMTSSMPWKRAPSCATGPLSGKDSSYSLGLFPFRQTAGDFWELIDPSPVSKRTEPLCAGAYELLLQRPHAPLDKLVGTSYRRGTRYAGGHGSG